VFALKNILYAFFWAFSLFSVILLPQMWIYNSGTAYSGFSASKVSYASGMLGNLGYSSVNCQITRLDVEQIKLSCPYGQIGNIT